MSRAYQIRVQETIHEELRAGDQVSARLELLGVLPPEEMAGLLRQELSERGFQNKAGGATLIREDPKTGVSIEVNPETGEVTASAQACRDAEVSGTKQGWGDTDWGRSGRDATENRLREELRKNLREQAGRKAQELQGEVTKQLEKELIDLSGELDQIVNKVTAEALKIKASRMGRIKEISENSAAGELTIKVEV